jgi:hypothetical protein
MQGPWHHFPKLFLKNLKNRKLWVIYDWLNDQHFNHEHQKLGLLYSSWG